MLPPHLASLTFVDDALGSDEAIVGRVASAHAHGRILVLGGSRPGLLRGLVERGCDVVVVDSSRTALRRTRDALGPDSGVLLLADDPRELTVPGGADTALITSAIWRAVLLPTDRRRVLHSVSGELRPGGRVLLEVERLPPTLPREPEAVPGHDAATWWRAASDPEGAMSVRAGDDTVHFATFSLGEALEDLHAAGFADVTLTDPTRGAPFDDLAAAAQAAYVWVSACAGEGHG